MLCIVKVLSLTVYDVFLCLELDACIYRLLSSRNFDSDAISNFFVLHDVYLVLGLVTYKYY